MTVDGVVRLEGDLLSRYTVTHHPGTPSEILAALQRRFTREDAVIDKLFHGQPLDDEDRALGEHLHSFTVTALSMAPSLASQAAEAWFERTPKAVGGA
jgi:hypothetical protein